MENIIKEGRTRREFLKGAGAVVAGGVVVGVVGSQLSCEELPGVANWWTPGTDPLTPAPNAEAYLVYDSHKCDGCLTCMAACSLVNEGGINLSLARLQIATNIYGGYPEDDIRMMVCRQCVYTPCIEVCPSGAFHVDADNGNTRTIDREVCADYQESISPDVCQLCMENCPYSPSIAVWNHEYGIGKANIEGVATVCDLCKSAPHWAEEGGVDGKQACIEACPMGMLQLVKEVPSQKDTEGYDVNLRNESWAELGFGDKQ